MFDRNKKNFLYEVDPLFFYDANNDGFGDFEGFIKKIDYFEFLGVDGVVFPDIFNQEEIILKKIQTTIFDKYGKMNELKNIIKSLNEKKINFFIKINLSKILNSNIIKESMDDLKSKDISKFIEEEISIDSNKQRAIDWNIERRIEAFQKIIEFWLKVGVVNFIFVDIEFLCEKENHLDNNLIKQLSFLYNKIKALQPKSFVGINSIFFSEKIINKIFKKYIGQICDFYIDSSFCMIGTDKKHPFDLMKKFNSKDVLKKIRKLNIERDKMNKYFISLNTNRIGRVNSRWFNEENLIDESNKLLLMMSNMLPYSTVNYYGDEIGILRLKIEDIKDFHDYEFVEKKRMIETQKHKNVDFKENQKFLSRINSQSLFMWNSNVNGGFTNNKINFRKLPINYLTHNLKDEIDNSNSVVNFYKQLIEINKNLDKEQSIFKIKLKFKKMVFWIKLISQKDEKLILINFSKKSVNVKINKKWKVILSTFVDKKYMKKITSLCPYESLILIR